MSKNIGIIKKIDSLGRVVIPKEYRDRLELKNQVELILTEDGLIIRNFKYKSTEFDINQDKIQNNSSRL